MICDPWEVVVVPFPFTDKPDHKRRPAVILSRRSFNEAGHSILAMITSTRHDPWPGDSEITDLAAVGLHSPSLVRLKLFTLDNHLIVRTIGALSAPDCHKVQNALGTFFA